MNIILIGFKNAGKTSVGKILAHRLEREFIDTDDALSHAYVKSHGAKLEACEIFKKEGEVFFRELESALIQNLKNKKDTIIATGGGVVLAEGNRRELKEIGTIIYLDLTEEDLIKRFDHLEKPEFLEEMSFEKMYQERKPIYESLADITINGANRTTEDIAKEIINHGI